MYRYKVVKKINGFLNESLADCVIATSEVARQNLIKQGLRGEKIVTILNGTDGFKEISQEEKAQLRRKYKIESDDIVIGYLARIEELKGHAYLLEAAKILKEKKQENIKFLLMGTGSYEEEAKRKVKEWQLEDCVCFTGFLKEPEKELNIVDIQVNASYLSETTNLALLEGMSLGIPTVATKCGGTTDMIQDFENGILVEKASAKALADGILQMIANKEMFQKMKQTSKMIFEQKYTSKQFAKAIERVYEKVLMAEKK